MRPAHDYDCEADFIHGPMLWTDCRCPERARERDGDRYCDPCHEVGTCIAEKPCIDRTKVSPR